ncbi:MAG: hypothetical protein AMXMBFR84_31780 [Candidatus Hydrogenedentota bacterium]
MNIRISQTMPAHMFYGFLVALMGPLAVVAYVSHAHVEAKADYRPEEIDAAKESIALSLMGQLQLSIGDIMWLKSMEYLHMGMVQRMPTQAEEQRGHMRKDSEAAPTGLAHTEGLQMVTDKERDWRGLFGEIERSVKPYDTVHKHDDPVELIPWYELAVKMNPGLERLYTLGAFYLADFANEPAEAREMLEAGVKANPSSFEIHGALGRLYFEYADRLDSLVHADEGDVLPIKTDEEAYALAIDLLTKAVELGKAHRLQMAERREVFDDTQNQVFGESYLYLSKAYAVLGRYDEGVAAASEGFETATRYSQRNLLRVQERTVQRLIDGDSSGADVEDAATTLESAQ